MTTSLRLSVLDLLPVRSGQSSQQAVDAARSLARVADDAGVHRYWLAEHHNMPGIASTSPAVIMGLLAAETSRMRLGSGGVMLPNHAPLAVAEQFALLEAAFPGRIDLGIGRAPGTDPVTSWALRGGSGDDEIIRNFPEYVQQVVAFMNPEGAAVQVAGRRFDIQATPKATAAPPVWLLGSSDYSARLAAQLGLPYVFAHHFAGKGTDEALRLYRDSFAGPGEPTTFLTANVAVADSPEQAQELALPYQLTMADLHAGATLRPIRTIEEARTSTVSADLLARIAKPWFVGTPQEVAQGLRELAAHYNVDEVMVHPVDGAFSDEPLDRTLSREQTIRDLAAELAVAGH